jgi:hypothetical protein
MGKTAVFPWVGPDFRNTSQEMEIFEGSTVHATGEKTIRGSIKIFSGGWGLLLGN